MSLKKDMVSTLHHLHNDFVPAEYLRSALCTPLHQSHPYGSLLIHLQGQL